MSGSILWIDVQKTVECALCLRQVAHFGIYNAQVIQRVFEIRIAIQSFQVGPNGLAVLLLSLEDQAQIIVGRRVVRF